MEKVWHNFNLWEDLGMWLDIDSSSRHGFLSKAVEFTGQHNLYGEYMLKVIDTYPVACEHNLTDTGMNRRAWIGHAACFLATGCPEYITRAAWALLSEEQQRLANKKADQAIAIWEKRYESKNKGLDREMEGQGVFRWDS